MIPEKEQCRGCMNRYDGHDALCSECRPAVSRFLAMRKYHNSPEGKAELALRRKRVNPSAL